MTTGAEHYLNERTEGFWAEMSRRVHAAYCGCGGAGGPADLAFVKQRFVDVEYLVPVPVSDDSQETDA